jgi:hypothetical protein
MDQRAVVPDNKIAVFPEMRMYALYCSTKSIGLHHPLVFFMDSPTSPLVKPLLM